MLIKSLLRMLRTLGLYRTQFEGYFLEETKIFYKCESERVVSELSISEILCRFEKWLVEEGQRVIEYLDNGTRAPLIKTVDNVALNAHVDELLEKGLDELADKNMVPDLKRLYTLLARVDALAKLKGTWNAYIKSRGTAMVMDEENDKSMIEQILKFKEKIDLITKLSFQSNEHFLYSQKEAFEDFINRRKNVPAELLSKFLDSKLKGGKDNRNLTEVELEALLDTVMQIFRYLSAKDVFEAFYKKHLSRRLLLNKSVSIDIEKTMIQKLKTECGSSFTSKLEGMFKDVTVSNEVTEAFKESTNYQKWEPKTVDAKVSVLTTGFWPPYVPIMCNLPPELSSFCHVFEEFYLDRYNGRRLTWQHSMGQCSVVGLFPKGKKDLEVSLFQAVVLNLFNENEKLTFSAIQTATNLEEGELKRTLSSIACGSTRVLNKLDTTVVERNTKYRCLHLQGRLSV
eukprot:TRINITY_DN7072_c0_g1_i4.p1 TRINITY_DN7072_c0_g1~~TRINITY_DN7072_c0_g1_i4.p1  ORF type:complete len:456 (-),score=107.39 TRINITY_DN7072_c0_g1_i4:355-1722(-)